MPPGTRFRLLGVSRAARARSVSLSVSSLSTSFSTLPLLTLTTPLAVSSRPCSPLTGAVSMGPPFATRLPPKPTSDRLPRIACGAPRAPVASVPWSSNRSPRQSRCRRSELPACRLLRFHFSRRLLCLSRLPLCHPVAVSPIPSSLPPSRQRRPPSLPGPSQWCRRPACRRLRRRSPPAAPPPLYRRICPSPGTPPASRATLLPSGWPPLRRTSPTPVPSPPNPWLSASCPTLAVSRGHAAGRPSPLAISTSPPPRPKASQRQVTRLPSFPTIRRGRRCARAHAL